jgi:hypothetical protein
VPGPSSSCVPWSNTPPGVTCCSPSGAAATMAFGRDDSLGTRNDLLFVAASPRPTCSRAYASPTASPPPSQGSLPTWAGSPLAGRDSHPLDDERNFIASSHPRLPSDQPCLVAPSRVVDRLGRRIEGPGIARGPSIRPFGATRGERSEA